MPAEAGDLARMPCQSGTDGGVVGDAAAEQIADESFDGVGFIECHGVCTLIRIALLMLFS